ncbi:MAG: flagellar hook-associated protein FlgK [Deltaproteobacteria bacterium]|nr:flagellar hook-associated protein FlgK [Deltaproteobacteria bacterium]
MSSLGLVLSIAKDALSAQRYGMNVTAHNIANVNTPGYSRQTAVYETKEPAPYGGVLLGRGVDTTDVLRASDQFIENRLMQQKSTMFSSKEMENYIQVLEGLFSEDSEMSISTMLSDFWNSWHDIANNPSGAPERIALYEHSILLSGQFNNLDADLRQLEMDLTGALSAGTERINQITSEIAQLNDKIAGMETNSIANDLRDKRNTLVSELSEYLDVKSFEQSNGSLTVITAKGCVLVHGNDSYELEMGGDSGDRVLWEGSGGATVDITNYMSNGKLGGWLDMRDEVIAKYKLDLDALAEEFIWTVNQQHSQGVGLQLFNTAVTGTYKTGSSGLLSTLTYGSKIDYTKDFKMWTYDSGSSSPVPVEVDMGVSTADPTYGGDFNVADTTYTIEITQGGTVNTDAIKFSWSETGGTSGTATMAAGSTNVAIDGNTLNFTAGDILVAGNTLKINTLDDGFGNGTPKPTSLSPTGTANSVLDTYKFTVTSVTGNGEIGTDTLNIDWANSVTSGSFILDAATTTVTVDGITLPFTVGDCLFAGDVFTITTDTNGTPTANLLSEWHWTLDSFINQFNRQTPRVAASKTSGNALTFAPDTSGTGNELTGFSYSGGVTASNTTITVNNYDALTIAGANLQLERTAANTWQLNNNPGYAVTFTALDGANLDNGFYVILDGDRALTVTFGTSITTNGYVEFDITAATGTYTFAFSDDEAQDSGLMAAMGINTFFQGSGAGSIAVNTVLNNKDYIAAGQIDADGNYASGDNTNALAITDLQYISGDTRQWTCDRIKGNTSGSVTSTIENYYHSMVGSMGIKASSIERSSAFNAVMVEKLSGIRDSLSAVSLDEEMTNIIKFQYAYQAAAKLISVSDELLNTLLSVK